MLAILNPIAQMFDLDGSPLDDGRLYFGAVGQNPVTAPVTVYWDAAGVIPAAQPIRTLNGYPVRSGTPASVYASADYSMLVRNSAGAQVLYAPNSADFGNATQLQAQITALIASLANAANPAQGAGQVGLYDSLAPAFLKVTSDLLSLNEVSVLRFIDRSKWSAIADETNADDLSSNFNAAFGASTKGVNLFVPHGLYNADRIAMQYGNSSIRGERGAQIKHTTAGRYILRAVSLTGISISGLQFVGLGSSTAPLDSVGGFASTSTGLVALAACVDAKVERCAFSNFYNGLSAINCNGLEVFRNRVANWLVYGMLASLSKRFSLDHNYLKGCDQAGAANAYGVSATGDEAGGNIQVSNSISYNVIEDVPSWDAIMTHDVSALQCIANRIKNVRVGLDISYVSAANEIRELVLANNIIEATATDTYAGAPAVHNGILVSGFSATDRISNAVVVGNVIKNFFAMGGAPTFAGNAAHIALVHLDRAVVGKNIISGGGSVGSPAGIFLAGTVNQVALGSNVLQGSFPSGAIRAASLTSDLVSITGNVIKQTTTTDPAIQFSASTVASLAIDKNPNNSTIPFVQSGSTLTMANSGTVTVTLTGCTTAPTASLAWQIEGSLVTLTIPALTATSNANTCTITGLPSFLQPNTVAASCRIAMTDNSVFTSDVTANIAVGSGTITFQRAGSATGFNVAGTKGPSLSTVTYSLN